jgi:hypothetical protein
MNETPRHPMDAIREEAKAKHKKANDKHASANGEDAQAAPSITIMQDADTLEMGNNRVDLVALARPW